jgi:hypothetical protein
VNDGTVNLLMNCGQVNCGSSASSDGQQMSATINNAQLVSLSVSFGANAPNGSTCSAVIFENGAALRTSDGSSVINAVSNGTGNVSAHRTYFLVLPSGTYSLFVRYTASEGGNGGCDFSGAQLSLQSYGAGSSLQSSGTF